MTNLVYHYTTISALENIFKSQSLWLSHISSLNDASEFEHGIHWVIDFLTTIPANASHKRLLENLRGALIAPKEHMNFCIGSFCKDGDKLSQWRAYTNDGEGVAIGFDSHALQELCNQSDGKYLFDKCAYSDQEKQENVLTLLKRFKDDYGGFESNLGLIAIAQAAAFLKHKSFSEEQELRIFTTPSIELKIRHESTRTIPYHKFDFCNMMLKLIRAVIIGPSVQQIAICKAVEVFLNDNKFQDCKVMLSEIPYRGFRYRQ